MNKKSELITGKIGMSIEGNPTEMEISVPARPVKPKNILPTLQKMTNHFVQIGVDKIQGEGADVSCKAGCGACCDQIVPISKIEAHQIARLVNNLPVLTKRKVLQKFEAAYNKLDEAGWFEKMGTGKDTTFEERQELGMEYFRQGISCPFLENSSCSIHADRPVACREYLVTSPAENCSAPTAENIKMVPIPKKISGTLYKLSEELLDDGQPGYIPMISVLKWTQENPDTFPVKPGVEWLEQIMEKMKPKNQDGEST